MAYGWCSIICKEYPDLEDGEELLFLSLKIGFRGLDVRYHWTDVRLVHTGYHQRMVEVVFDSGDEKVIADLLHAWTASGSSHMPHKSLNTCARYIVGLRHLQSFSSRLQHLVIRSLRLIGFQQFKQVGVEELILLLDRLRVGADDVGVKGEWLELLLSVVQSPEGRRSLPHLYWELLVELEVTRAGGTPATILTQIVTQTWSDCRNSCAQTP